MGIDICGEDSIYLPPSGSCDECAEFAQRLEVVEDTLPDKQDKLTAGDNITIENNVISSTGGGGGDSYWTASGDYITPVSSVDGVQMGNASSGAVYTDDGQILMSGNGSALTINATGVSGLPGVPQGDTYATSKKYVDDQLALKQDELTEGDGINIASDVISVDTTSPIVIESGKVAHADSGVTAGSKGDTANQTPAFGDTFKAVSGTVNAKGHLTAFAEHTVKIPDTKATTTADGLMSKEDKATVDGLPTNYQKKLTAGNGISIDAATNTISATGVSVTVSSPITLTGSTIGHADSGVTAGSKGDTSAQTPAFGGTFKALSATVNATGHTTALAEHTVTIPNTKASSTADGLMSKEDKATFDAIPTTYQPTISVTSPITKTGNTIAHADSGVTAGSKGDTTAQTPSWGGTFKALSGTVDAKGHMTAFAEHTVTIPSAKASSTADGLMSKEDKATLDDVPDTYASKDDLDDIVTGLVAFDTVSLGSAEVAANNWNAWQVAYTPPANYTPVGIVGFTTGNGNVTVSVCQMYNNRTQIYLNARNNTSTARTTTPTVIVMNMKTQYL